MALRVQGLEGGVGLVELSITPIPATTVEFVVHLPDLIDQAIFNPSPAVPVVETGWAGEALLHEFDCRRDVARHGWRSRGDPKFIQQFGDFSSGFVPVLHLRIPSKRDAV